MSGEPPPDPVVEVRGQSLLLLPERAVFWRDRSTLLVADTHFGKAATFRRAGFAVPAGTTAEALLRLDSALDRTGAGRLVILGDLLHAREGRAPATLQALAAWRDRRSSLHLVLVRGNHDRSAGDPPEALRIECVDPVFVDPPFAFAHHPRDRAGGYVLAGHLHPAARLVGPGRQRARMSCFWFRREHAILPAFGDFTGSADITPTDDDGVWVIAGSQVLRVR